MALNIQSQWLQSHIKDRYLKILGDVRAVAKMWEGSCRLIKKELENSREVQWLEVNSWMEDSRIGDSRNIDSMVEGR